MTSNISQPVPDAVASWEETQLQEYAQTLTHIKWKELVGYWFKPIEERRLLRAQYNAAERVIGYYCRDGVFGGAKHELIKKQEDASGVMWADIVHRPEYCNPEESGDDHCAVCDSRREEIEQLKASGKIYFDPQD